MNKDQLHEHTTEYGGMEIMGKVVQQVQKDVDSYIGQIDKSKARVKELKAEIEHVKAKQVKCVMAQDFANSNVFKGTIKKLQSEQEDTIQYISLLEANLPKAFKDKLGALNAEYMEAVEGLKKEFKAQEAIILKAKQAYIETLEGLKSLREKAEKIRLENIRVVYHAQASNDERQNDVKSKYNTTDTMHSEIIKTSTTYFLRCGVLGLSVEEQEFYGVGKPSQIVKSMQDAVAREAAAKTQV